MPHTSHDHHHGEEHASPASIASGFELNDWQWRPVLLMTIAVLAMLALGYVVVAILVAATGGTVGDTSHTLLPTSEARVPPEPRLEQNPTIDGTRLVAEARVQIESYGWVDQRAGTAHIPIDRAKQLLLQRGISPFTGEQAAPAASQPTAAPSDEVAISFDAALAAQGEQIFVSLGCIGCHRLDAPGIGPSLVGVYGSEQTLEGGGTALADEAYLRESILNSSAKIVAGYQPVMPPYQGQLNDSQVQQLLEYIKSLADTNP